MTRNHLSNAYSPYLLQHANNPVDWYPWSTESITKARDENKPILLSIGYAACHWCHVMAHESFEDEETAKLMNEFFINIKVDREERPDLDKVYQTAHYLLTQQPGGWPLTVFLSPNTLTPFYTGTYFPKESHHQLPAFKDVLIAIHNLYVNESHQIELQNKEITRILNAQTQSMTHDIKLNLDPIQKAILQFKNNFDEVNGGFGYAPKFPQEAKLLFLLSMQSTMAEFTLQKISQSGLVDQLAGN